MRTLRSILTVLVPVSTFACVGAKFEIVPPTDSADDAAMGAAGAAGVAGASGGPSTGGAPPAITAPFKVVGGGDGAAGAPASIAGAGGSATAGGGGASGHPAVAPGSCDAASPAFKCNANVLERCNVDAGAYETVKSCDSSARCDAQVGRCYACDPGEVNPSGVCLDGARDVCREDRSGFGQAEPCGNGTTCVANACVGCTDDADCAAESHDSACGVPACVSGTCGIAPAPLGTPVSGDGTCAPIVCDGKGGRTVQPAAVDAVVVPTNACNPQTCDGMGQPVSHFVPAGASCGEVSACDGQGGCQECDPAPGSDGRACADHLWCTPGQGPAADGYFVSQKRGDDANQGSMVEPFATVARAIAALRNDPTRSKVYVASGAYVENVTITGVSQGVTLEGGWIDANGTWSRDCTSGDVSAYGLARITAPVGGADQGAIRVDNDGPVELRDLTVEGADLSGVTAPADAGGGASIAMIALRAGGVGLTLTATAVLGGHGGRAGAASTGQSATVPYQCVTGAHGGASDGANGSPSGARGLAQSSSGAFSGATYEGGAGTDGEPGTAGHNGTAAPSFGAVSCEEDSCGFQAGVCTRSSTTTTSASRPGTYGCGSSGAGGGRGGHEGGPSIGLVAVPSAGALTVTLVAARLSGGEGGDGADGGPSGSQVMGTKGAAGEGGSCVSHVFTSCASSSTLCVPAPGTVSQTKIAPAPAGGNGGVGSSGGAGGAGRGGRSHGIYTAPGVTLLPSASTVIAAGTAGKGGQWPTPAADGPATPQM